MTTPPGNNMGKLYRVPGRHAIAAAYREIPDKPLARPGRMR
jgi:hypothetical protein